MAEEDDIADSSSDAGLDVPGPVIDEQHTSLTFHPQTLMSHLSCGLCHGLLRDCMTVKECLHRFCKSCAVLHFGLNAQTKLKCPTCGILLEEFGMKALAADHTLDSVINKVCIFVSVTFFNNSFSLSLSTSFTLSLSLSLPRSSLSRLHSPLSLSLSLSLFLCLSLSLSSSLSLSLSLSLSSSLLRTRTFSLDSYLRILGHKTKQMKRNFMLKGVLNESGSVPHPLRLPMVMAAGRRKQPPQRANVESPPRSK